MKKIIFAFLLMAFAFGAQAQYKQVNVGVGLDGNSIPLFVGLDIPVAQNITLGGEIGWRRYNEHFASYDYYDEALSILFNANYHFGEILKLPKQWDIYGGLNIGFVKWSNNWNGNNYPGSYSSGLALGAQVGVRYYFNDKIGLGLEFCGGNQVSATKLGLSIRF